MADFYTLGGSSPYTFPTTAPPPTVGDTGGGMLAANIISSVTGLASSIIDALDNDPAPPVVVAPPAAPVVPTLAWVGLGALLLVLVFKK